MHLKFPIYADLGLKAGLLKQILPVPALIT